MSKLQLRQEILSKLGQYFQKGYRVTKCEKGAMTHPDQVKYKEKRGAPCRTS